MESRTFHQRADTSKYVAGGGGHLPAHERDLAGRGGDQAEEHADCGGLSRTVRAQETVDRTIRNLQVDVIDGNLAPESLCQPTCDDGRGIG
jgi:hypothetical protein